MQRFHSLINNDKEGSEIREEHVNGIPCEACVVWRRIRLTDGTQTTRPGASAIEASGHLEALAGKKSQPNTAATN